MLGSRSDFLRVGKTTARFWEEGRKPSDRDLYNRYSKNGIMSSNMSTITNGGKGSNSHDFKLDDVRRRRRFDSKMGRNSLNADSVAVKRGGGEPAVESRRPSSLVVSMARKSSAENDGVADVREERPS